MSEERPADETDVFDIEKIRELIELMKEHDLSEIDLRHMPKRIRLRRGGESNPVAVGWPAGMPPGMPATGPVASSAGSESAAGAEAAAEADEANIQLITSPMVGTFYDKPKPDAPNFVKVGDRVDPDTTVCLVEAMKMFNEIPAGISGVIVEVLAKNEEPVDVNRPLFKVKTD